MNAVYMEKSCPFFLMPRPKDQTKSWPIFLESKIVAAVWKKANV